LRRRLLTLLMLKVAIFIPRHEPVIVDLMRTRCPNYLGPLDKARLWRG
jgi:hypothetical protein